MFTIHMKPSANIFTYATMIPYRLIIQMYDYNDHQSETQDLINCS